MDRQHSLKDKNTAGQRGKKDLPLCCVPEASKDDSAQHEGTAILLSSRLTPPGTDSTRADVQWTHLLLPHPRDAGKRRGEAGQMGEDTVSHPLPPSLR